MKKTALVTGAIGGIGTEICKQLSANEIKVIATFRPTKEFVATKWKESLGELGENIHIYPVDVSQIQSCELLLKVVREKHGLVNVLVNNAGITRDATLKRMDWDMWSDVLKTNLDSVFNMSKQVFANMCDQGWGRIVNISSINGQKGQFGQVNYSAAKAGINGFTKALAQEGAKKGVTVNSISPGYISTEMVTSLPQNVIDSIVNQIPVGRLGKPEEIARVVSFLVDEGSGFITGSNIAINGGQYM